MICSSLPAWPTTSHRGRPVIEWLRSDFFSVFWPEILVGVLDLLPTLQTCLDQANIDMPAHRVVDYWFAMDSKVNQEILAHCEALRTAKIMVYLATNQDHLRARYLMKDLNLSAHVAGIFSSAQLGVVKPDPDFYQYITSTGHKLWAERKKNPTFSRLSY